MRLLFGFGFRFLSCAEEELNGVDFGAEHLGLELELESLLFLPLKHQGLSQFLLVLDGEAEALAVEVEGLV